METTVIRVMLNFLKDHSTEIQAFGAVVSAFVTIVLAFLTSLYVRLTSRLVRATENQLSQYLKTEEQSRIQQKREALVLADHFRKQLEELPYYERDAASFSKCELWQEEELRSFQNAMVAIGSQCATLASQVCSKLRWIRDFSSRCENGPISQDEWRYYMSRLNACKSDLGSLPLCVLNDRAGYSQELGR